MHHGLEVFAVQQPAVPVHLLRAEKTEELSSFLRKHRITIFFRDPQQMLIDVPRNALADFHAGWVFFLVRQRVVDARKPLFLEIRIVLFVRSRK